MLTSGVLLAVFLSAVGIVDVFSVPLSFATKRYDGFQVLTVLPESNDSINLLRGIAASNFNIDFWKLSYHVGVPSTFMVPPEHLNAITTKLNKAKINFRVDIDDVQRLLTPMWDNIERSKAKQSFDLSTYNDLSTIYSWMSELASNCRSGLTCSVVSIGNSFEGRSIQLFTIKKNGTSGRKAYWVDGTIHAREWIATATVTSILNHLATGGDDNAVRLTELYDWYILPIVNPDGYSYTWTTDRLWRKNRRPVSSSCIGVDLNRNFNFRWGHDGVSRQPCSQMYCGPSAGSEPETAAVSRQLDRLGPTLAAVVTVHSYGQMWMFPWGNTVNYTGNKCEVANDNNEMMLVASAAANAVEDTFQTTWTRGNSCQVIYSTTGGTDDYAKGKAGVKYAFSVELRGQGFVLNESQIAMSFHEMWNGIVAMCDTISA